VLTLFLTATDAVLSLATAKTPHQGNHHPMPHLATGAVRRGVVARLGLPNSMHPHALQQPQQVVQSVLRLHLAGANPHPQVVGLDRLPGVSNYFIGRDPRHWRTNVPAYARVAYRNIYPGVDLVYYGNQGRLEYDLVVAPGATTGTIRLTVAGARQVHMDRAGNVVLRLAAGDLHQIKPAIYQQVDGAKQEVRGRYVVFADHTIGFHIDSYDRHKPLVIDPTLVYSTYLGGIADNSGGAYIGIADNSTGIAVDGSGAAYVTGDTISSDFPTTPGAFSTTLPLTITMDRVAFVTKLAPSGGALVYSTYLGGGNARSGGIAVDGSGAAYVTGYTYSSDFPTTPGAFSTTLPMTNHRVLMAFVTKLAPSGAALVYSTYLGGSVFNFGTGIAVDGSGAAYVTGGTSSSDFPTTPGAFSTTYHYQNHDEEAFVTKLTPSGAALVYSTYLGGSGYSSNTYYGYAANGFDYGGGITVDGAGAAYVTGGTSSGDFPTTPGAFSTTYHKQKLNYNGEAFVTKLAPSGGTLVYSTYLGGSGSEGGSGIAVDGSGAVYVTGSTSSGDFPTTPGAFSTAYHNQNSDAEAFVTKLAPSGAALVYSTYLGGSGYGDYGTGIAVDGAGAAYVTGRTASNDFPTTPGAFSTTYHYQAPNPDQAPKPEAFVTKLVPSGTTLVYSTYLGGSGASGGEGGTGVAVDGSGAAYVTGETTSSDFPTTPGAFSTTRGGGSSVDVSNVFIAKLYIPSDAPAPTATPTPPAPAPAPTVTPAPATSFTVTDLGTLGGLTSTATGLNDAGQIVGYSATSDGTTHAFRTVANMPINPATDDLGTLGGPNSQATGINASGQVAGTSENSQGVPRAFRTAANARINPFTDDLGTLGGITSTAAAINASGQVVGYALTSDGKEHAYRTAANRAIDSSNDDLETLGGSNSAATGISDDGTAVGSTDTGNGTTHAFVAGSHETINSSSNDLGVLDGGTNSAAAAINSGDHVVGSSDASGGVSHGFFADNYTPTDMGTLTNGHDSAAMGINAADEVVGYGDVPSSAVGRRQDHAFVSFRSAGLLDLNGFLPSDSGWVLEEATAINGKGQIVGYGLHNGQQHAFLMTPNSNGALPTVTPSPTPTNTPTPTPTAIPGLSLVVDPSSVPADGSSTAKIILSGLSTGRVVRLSSSRGNMDTISPSNGVAGFNGQVTAVITSSTPGNAIITARDLITGQPFGASDRILFTGSGGPPSASTGEDIRITGIEGHCGQLECPVDGFFALGLDGLNLPLKVGVDWKNHPRGNVEFSLNDHLLGTVADAGPGQGADFDFNISALYSQGVIHTGVNVLKVVARSGSASSRPQERSITGYVLPQWMLDGMNAVHDLPFHLLDANEIVVEVAFPGQSLCKRERFKPKEPCQDTAFGFPGEANGFQFQTTLILRLPLRGGSFEVEIDAARNRAETGRQPKAFLASLGHNFNLDFSATLGANLTTKAPYVHADELAIEAAIGCPDLKPTNVNKVKDQHIKTLLQRCSPLSLEYDLGLIDALNGLPTGGPALAAILNRISPVKDWLNKRAKVYITLSPSLSGDVTLQFPEDGGVQPKDAGLTAGLDLEIGALADLYAAEVHLYAGLKGRVEIGYQRGNFGGVNIASAQAAGYFGYAVRLLWFSTAGGETVALARYPPKDQPSIRSELRSLTGHDLRLIHSSATARRVRFYGAVGAYQAFARPVRALHAAASGVVASPVQTTTASILESGVYTYTEPSLSVDPATGKALLLWVHDDPTKPANASKYIVFSSWNGSSWTTAAPLDTDGLLEGAPQVSWTNHGTAVAVWHRLTAQVPLTATFDATTADQVEIATATYSATTGTWSPVSALTPPGTLNMAPRLARNSNGKLLAVWRQNAAGQIQGDATNPDQIMVAFYDQGHWSTPIAAVSGVPGLDGLAVGYGVSAATLAYSRLVTPTDGLTPTLQLFTSTWDGTAWSVPTQRTDGVQGSDRPQVVYNTANQPLLLWLTDGMLHLRNLVTGAEVTLTLPANTTNVDEFRVVEDGSGNIAAVLTAQATQRDLYVAYYDQAHNLWGNPVQLTNDTANEVYPTAGMDASGRLLAAYASTALTPITSTEVISSGEVVTYTVPTEGQTDLVTLSHSFVKNLTLGDSDLALSNDHPAAGQSVVISATVHNSGDLPLDGVAVGFYDGDPAHGGTFLSTDTLTSTLAAGFTATETLSYTPPLMGGPHTIYAVADPSNAIPESDETDNTGKITAFGPDLALTDATIAYWSGHDVGLEAAIQNLGTSAAPASVLTLYEGAITGTALVTDSVPAIAPGQVVTLTTPWNYGDRPLGSYPLVVAVNPSGSNFPEADTDNNVLTTTLDVLPDLQIDPDYLLASRLPNGREAITATVFNVGSVPSMPTDLTLYADTPFTDTGLITQTALPAIAPGSYATITTTWDNATPGVHTYYAVANETRAISETSYANNLASVDANSTPLDVTPTPTADGTAQTTGTPMPMSISQTTGTPTSTATALPTSTPTMMPTASVVMPVPTPTSTATLLPTGTATNTASPTSTATATGTPIPSTTTPTQSNPAINTPTGTVPRTSTTIPSSTASSPLPPTPTVTTSPPSVTAASKSGGTATPTTGVPVTPTRPTPTSVGSGRPKHPVSALHVAVQVQPRRIIVGKPVRITVRTTTGAHVIVRVAIPTTTVNVVKVRGHKRRVVHHRLHVLLTLRGVAMHGIFTKRPVLSYNVRRTTSAVVLVQVVMGRRTSSAQESVTLLPRGRSHPGARR